MPKCLNAPQEMKHKQKKTEKIEPYQPVVVARQIALTKMIQQEEQGHLRSTALGWLGYEYESPEFR